MRRPEEPPLPPPSPAAPSPSRFRRTLRSLRAPFRPGSPFHLGALARSGSGKSSASASDGDLARDERTMRKRNKKTRDSATASDASRSTDSSPGDKKKKEGFMRRMGSIGKKRAEDFASASAPSLQPGTKESSLESDPVPASEPRSFEASTSKSPTPEVPTSKEPTPEVTVPERSISKAPAPELVTPVHSTPTTSPSEACPAPPAPEHAAPGPAESVPAELTPEPSIPHSVSPIAVSHPVATLPFTKSAWKRRSALEVQRPVEEPSPESALRRRIAFVAQMSACLSEDRDEGEGRGEAAVGSLEEAVALARARLAPPPSRPQSRGADTEEEGYSDAMPAYGDLIEPANKPGSEPSHASPSAERREHLYKILVIGELGTGKTSIIKRYVHQFFSQHYRATIGVDFALKVLNWDANTVIRLQLWDIAGQERFGNMTRVYYKEAVGAFIVFDVSRVATFDAVVKWKNDLDAKVQLPDGSPIPCILLANKCDQQKEGIVNSPTKMDEYCREKGFAGWFETSAKENINIEEAARSLVNKILLNDKLLQSNDTRDGDKFALEHKIANGENSRDSSGKSCNC